MTGFTSDHDRNDAIARLKAEGFVVTLQNFGPVTFPRWVWQQHARHLTYSGFYARLRSFKGFFPMKRGAQGRMRYLRTTPELIAWIARPAEAGKRRDLRGK